jgi:hypothetical protein
VHGQRITTREALDLLGLRRPAEALALLKAAGVEATRCGNAWLWRRSQVAALKGVLSDRAAQPPSTGAAR